MDKLSCIEEYFASIRAYYLYQAGKFFNIPDSEHYILNKKFLNGAKVAFVSNLMLGIKEDLVDNKGNLEYESKVFVDSLENSVNMIATKVPNGYRLSNYVFPDAATLVAIVRNKLAHGKYGVDLEHNRIILTHKGVDIIINIDKLICFVLMGFRSIMKDGKDTEYERNIVYYIKPNPKRKEKIKDLTEVRGIAKKFNYVSFKIESLNDMPVFKDCIQYLERFIKLFGTDVANATKSDYYRDMIKYLAKRNCKLTIVYKSLKDKGEIAKILNVASADILNNDHLSYDEQIRLIGAEVQKSINADYQNFNAINANVNNIIMLNAINSINSVDDNNLVEYISRIFPQGIKFGYDEFGMTLLAMFNSLYIYPFDDVYDVSGEYDAVRTDMLDFSILDLSMLNPTIVTINDAPLVNVKSRLDSVGNKVIDVTNKIQQQQTNLGKIKNNPSAIAKINQNISDLNNSLSILQRSYLMIDNEYQTIKNDFTVNHIHFFNKAIIEGIRNAIAHGHYEFVSKGDIWDTEIIFKDIYEGKITFQVSVTFAEFSKLIDNNYMNVLNFVQNKYNSKKK